MKKTIGIPLEGFSELSRITAGEGMVLLKNEDQMLPVKQNQVISLFGRCQINYYRSGTGSGGAVNIVSAINALEGIRKNPSLTLNEELVQIYESWAEENPFDNGGGGWASEPWFQEEMPLTDELVSRASEKSDKAVIIIGRTAGEDKDNADKPGSYTLTKTEEDMIALVCAHFTLTAVIMNVTNIMDMSWLETMENGENIKAVLFSWAAGGEGGHALADILSGHVSPSGRLTDTIAYHLADYPAAENFGSPIKNFYKEDIYVGYRYFETFHPKAVQFAFGEGLSYASFSHLVENITLEGVDAEGILQFQVKVINTGTSYAGKEVVQIYCEAPQGKLGKPARTLVAFAKTDLLKPGEETILTLSLSVKSLASYDDSGVTGHKSCYILEQGLYQFYSGRSVKEAELIEVGGWKGWMVYKPLVTEELSECMAPVEEFSRIKPGVKFSDGTYEVVHEPVPLRTVSLQERIESRLPAPLMLTGNRDYKLRDVESGKVSLEDFVAQMTQEDLAALVRAEGMCSPKVTPGTASAFGGLTGELFKLGIPVACASDGPSGIRMDSGHRATQVPIGTLLASTWNKELIEELYYLEGQEMQSNQIDTLLGPGINIHRHPLNGRNFEYFSEDPFLTGSFAAAQTRGLKRAGVSGTIKHFAANDQETARYDADSILSERALREIHLKGFEMAVKEGGASSIMTAYNPVNGHWTASHYDLNTSILRGEWGFTGIVMTDWWAKMNDPVQGGSGAKTFTSYMVRAQNDLYMVIENDGAYRNAAGDDTAEALEKGTLTVGELQRSAMNICRFILNAPVMKRELKAYDPIKSYTPQITLSGMAARLENGLEFNTSTNKTLAVGISESGVYAVTASIRYEKNSLAQSSLSLYFNDDYAVSIPINGTEGEWISKEGLKVRLEKGFYELRVDFVKPGMELGKLTFVRE